MSVVTRVAAAAQPGRKQPTEQQNPGVGNATQWAPTAADPGSRSKRARIGRQWSVGGGQLSRLCAHARDHPVHLQAIAAIASDVTRWPLTWARTAAANTAWAPADGPQPPAWCHAFIHDAIESIGIAGYFAHVTRTNRTYIVPPETYTIAASDDSPEWTPVPQHEADRGLTLVIVHPPRRDSVRSPALQAAQDTQRYDALERNFIRRDTRNSEHTVYTSISSDLKNQNGSTRQWFRSALADEAAGARPSVDTDFNQLIKRRADTVRDLAMHTQAARAELATYMGKRTPKPLGAPPGGDDDDDSGKTAHTEHMVTDGREFSAATHLQSLTDGSKELDRVYTQIMLAYQVPPQIFGKNINTERHAASNRLTESAVQLFARYCARIRSIVEDVIKAATKQVDGKSYVAFRPVIDHGILERLAPALKPAFVASTVAAAHGVPEHAIIKTAICDAVAGDTKQREPAAKGAHPAQINRKEDKA